jgi:hypothetical protein
MAPSWTSATQELNFPFDLVAVSSQAYGRNQEPGLARSSKESCTRLWDRWSKQQAQLSRGLSGAMAICARSSLARLFIVPEEFLSWRLTLD